MNFEYTTDPNPDSNIENKYRFILLQSILPRSIYYNENHIYGKSSYIRGLHPRNAEDLQLYNIASLLFLGNHIKINMNIFLTVFNKYYLNRIKVGIYPKVKINVWFITKSIF